MSIRTERVAGVIKEQISQTLIRDIDTSGFGLITVTDVIMTPDLRLAKVYISHYRSDKSNDAVISFLEENKKTLRFAVGKSVRLKFTPELRFYIDETLDKMERMEHLFNQIHKEMDSR